MIAAVQFRINDKCDALIYPYGRYEDVDWNNSRQSLLGENFREYSFRNSAPAIPLLEIAETSDENYILRFKETKRYIIRLKCANDSDVSLPRLQNEKNKSLRCERDEDSLTFQFINYLGRSKIIFSEHQSVPVEIVPDKMNYEDDYIELTDSIASHCAELLLDYSGATSNKYSLSDNNSRTLLEQFIFLRQFCYEENIQGLFESIRRNPDRLLVEENEMQPVGTGIPSRKFYTQPFSYSRNWGSFTSSDGEIYYLPSEIAVTKKTDSLDTPANRFLKFALESFDNICECLLEALNKDGAPKQTECWREAKNLHYKLNDILRDHFFDEIGPLDVMPQNDQVLQKREGYSQIFQAYSMIDLALQLDWKGEDAVYAGESKNVALLYEYWLFYELFEIVRSIDGCVPVRTEDDPFISGDKGNLTISLAEGKKSCQSFVIERLAIKINLYYNRTFKPGEFEMTRYEGSYSRPFRPDYTLAIFPDAYNGENSAVQDGTVSYIHFDAKYRITDLTTIIGKATDNDDEINSEIESEKADEAINTYKRGDLLKMHTYNDAIRRTIGSYVLYPGDLCHSRRGNIFSLYDEILPGVGAFAIKPSIRMEGERELRKFITDIITEKTKNSSRLNRLRYYSEMVLREPASNEIPKRNAMRKNSNNRTTNNDMCVLGYIRNDGTQDYYHFLSQNGLLEEGSEFLFYYYAIRNGVVYSHHHDISKAGLLRFYTNHVSEKLIYHVEPILCRIEGISLVSKADLVHKLNEEGYKTEEEQHRADYYFVMKVRVVSSNLPEKDLKTEYVNSQNGNDSFSPHSPKVLNVRCFDVES